MSPLGSDREAVNVGRNGVDGYICYFYVMTIEEVKMSKSSGYYDVSRKVGLGRIKIRLLEIFHRIGHAVGIFKMRFLLLKVPTYIDLPQDFVFDEKKAKSRGRMAPDGKHYSSMYTLNWSDLPEAIKQEVKKFDSVLRLYFGGDYLIQDSTIWRNIAIPEDYRSLDIYSQVWHYDHVVDYRNVSLFILLTDTTENHGPFEYLENPSETDLHVDVEARNGVESTGQKVAKLTGMRGDGFWFATGAMPHRAGIPKFDNYRDIFCISFFPEYVGAGIGLEAKTLYAQDVEKA